MTENNSPGPAPGKIPEDETARHIGEIYRSEKLSDEDKDRLIAALLPEPGPQRRVSPTRLTLAFLASFFIPPAGVFFAFHFFLRFGDEGRRPGIACLVLTVTAVFLLRAVLVRLAGAY